MIILEEIEMPSGIIIEQRYCHIIIPYALPIALLVDSSTICLNTSRIQINKLIVKTCTIDVNEKYIFI